MIGWLVEALVASALLMALVLLVREPVRRAFGPGIAYALWALPLLRLALPPLPAAWRAAAPLPVAAASERVTVLIVPAAAPVHAAVASATPFPWATLLIGVWSAGALWLLARQIVAHARFVRHLGAEAETIAIHGRVHVLASPAAAGPLAIGIWRPRVFVPRDWAFDADERELALAHELAHHRRGDLVANWIALGVLAVHWFNPLAWRAFRAFRADQEQATDARVLAGRSSAEALAYGRAIVRAAAGLAVSPACHLNTLTDLKRRLVMLTRRRPTRRRLLAGSATIVLIVLAGLGFTASGSRAAAGVRAVANVPAVPPVPPAPMPAMPVMPAMPAMPQMAEAPPVPPAPPAPVAGVDREDSVTDDGKGHRVHRTVISDHDGAALANMPEVANRSCGEGAPPVIHSEHDGHQLIVICQDRIATMAQRATDAAARSGATERNAYAQALTGLRDARTRMQAKDDMPEDARREALAAIDQSIAELEQDLARAR